MNFEVTITTDTPQEGFEEECEGEFIKNYDVDSTILEVIRCIHDELNTTSREMRNTEIDEFSACYDLHVDGVTFNVEIE